MAHMGLIWSTIGTHQRQPLFLVRISGLSWEDEGCDEKEVETHRSLKVMTVGPLLSKISSSE